MSPETNGIEQHTSPGMSVAKRIGYALCGGLVAFGVALGAAEFVAQTAEYAEDLVKLVH